VQTRRAAHFGRKRGISMLSAQRYEVRDGRRRH